jgi:uncharacterized repeat protein (TIGR03809 family)
MMADQDFSCPTPRASGVPKTMTKVAQQWEQTALKWRSLAEQRRDHYLELYDTGRWTHYGTGEEFLAEMNDAIALAERWARIAPLPHERETLAEVVELVPLAGPTLDERPEAA